MQGFILVFIGGGLGAAARHGVNLLAVQFFGTRYPIATFCVNVVGSLLVGVLTEWFALRSQLPAGMRLLLVTGVLGGFTTFSAFSLEIGLLHERGDTAVAAAYAAASVVAAVAAMFAGMYAVRCLAAS